MQEMWERQRSWKKSYVKLCDEVVTVWEFTYLGNRVNTGGGCEAGVMARAKCGWV